MKKTVIATIIIIIVIVICTVVAVIFLLRDYKVTHIGEVPTTTNVSTTEISGVVKPPSGFKPTDFEIVSLGASTDVKGDGTFTTETYQEGVNTIAAMQKGKEFGLLKILIVPVSGETPQDIVINAMSTAVALVFITPFFATHDPVQTAATLTLIEKYPKVRAFAEVISQMMPESDPVRDPRYISAFKEALESVIATLDRE